MEARIKQLETMVKRLSRRQVKKTTAIITPYPISSCVIGDDVKGDILKYMFCSKGIVNKGLITLGKKPKNGVKIDIFLQNDEGGSTQSYVMSSKSFLCEPNIEVYSGDRLTVSVNPIEEDILNEVWLAFMWTPEMKEARIKNYLIKNLEKEDVFEAE